ncbi:hypothetical protein DPMN_106319 [Dreissena polymorpha]|uniref:Uncharacterized protein n=1 Tax=Dreissena polymorpha TaxID=45954 RepID=A0A9D4K4R3_DREPO|nr:hypothetical protein DPMN_106319 [Dreissena polymorpha]
MCHVTYGMMEDPQSGYIWKFVDNFPQISVALSWQHVTWPPVASTRRKRSVTS